MSVDVGVRGVIERPIAEVSSYAGDPATAPEWSRRIESAEWLTEAPVRLGSRIRYRARLLGRTFEYTYELVELSPGEQVAMRTIGGPFPMQTVYTWRPVGDRVTHMAIRHHGGPTGWRRVLQPLISRVLRRATTSDLAVLTRLLER